MRDLLENILYYYVGVDTFLDFSIKNGNLSNRSFRSHATLKIISTFVPQKSNNFSILGPARNEFVLPPPPQKKKKRIPLGYF